MLCNSSAGHVFLDRCGGNGAYFLKHNSGEIRVSKIRSQNRRRKWLDFAEDILMEDNDILVVHKHAGMAVQNARMGQMDLEHAALNEARAGKGGNTGSRRGLRFHIWRSVHRLDQPVEGVLVFAKNKDAAGKLGRQVQDGTMKKSISPSVRKNRKTGRAEV